MFKKTEFLYFPNQYGPRPTKKAAKFNLDGNTNRFFILGITSIVNPLSDTKRSNGEKKYLTVYDHADKEILTFNIDKLYHDYIQKEMYTIETKSKGKFVLSTKIRDEITDEVTGINIFS